MLQFTILITFDKEPSVYLLSFPPSCLPAKMLACHPACLPSCLHVRLPACSPAYLHAKKPPCLPACRFSCLPACLSACQNVNLSLACPNANLIAIFPTPFLSVSFVIAHHLCSHFIAFLYPVLSADLFPIQCFCTHITCLLLFIIAFLWPFQLVAPS